MSSSSSTTRMSMLSALITTRIMQLDEERGSVARPIVHAYGSPKAIHDGAHDKQTQAETAIMTNRYGALEGVKYSVQPFGWNTGAVIFNGKCGDSLTFLDPNRNRFSVAELDRVRDQVGRDLNQPEPVPLPDGTALGRD